MNKLVSSEVHCFDKRWNRIPFDLPLDVKAIIQTTPILLTGRGRDRIAWIGNPRGIFDLKSAYSIAMGTDSTPSINATWIWKSETLPRIKTFLWRCMHNSIGVKNCLAKRGIVEEDWCPICQRDPETILHALRDCPWVKEVWIQLGVKEMNQTFWMSNLHEWLDINGRVNSSYIQGKPPWRTMFNLLCGAFGRAGICMSLKGKIEILDCQQRLKTKPWSLFIV